ncbi:MAG: phenylacetate-CoA oxygenase subunit PaaC [Alicyclobacillus macrosporangiidus]|uniref:1,2-phenylacetyl-CoA epoxidase subunit PaaC n=1 Tax=Alicyclobacillus macrosporangiidus TaxID=392015 RepID=UPI0026EC02EA|nr:1,2-phenylacetyl-CoA epoxidase subunit PaaC [Alicyclobacillus macrosporangiidus]MCL6600021.1 phenylacetate-CoA oxygenase subunit PaaC [Alicyclobacillus macrosporangiidus]
MSTTWKFELARTVRAVLVDCIYQLADDELTLGHRDSEWLGLAPDVEEDVAFSSIAQDEVGHAAFYYEILEGLGEGTPDALAFDRPLEQRRNARLLERPNGDWAFTVLRHMLYDAWDSVRLMALVGSTVPALSQGAAKMLREERYHRMHMEMWVASLGQAGGEAKERLEAALRAIALDIPDLLSFGGCGQTLWSEGILTEPLDALRSHWLREVQPVLTAAGLDLSILTPELDSDAPVAGGRTGHHTPELKGLLQTMGSVHRLDPAARW